MGSAITLATAYDYVPCYVFGIYLFGLDIIDFNCAIK
jgi:hypothetical protein